MLKKFIVSENETFFPTGAWEPFTPDSEDTSFLEKCYKKSWRLWGLTDTKWHFRR